MTDHDTSDHAVVDGPDRPRNVPNPTAELVRPTLPPPTPPGTEATTSDGAVYADLTKLRYVVPALLALTVVSLGVVVLLQVFGSDPSLESEPVTQGDLNGPAIDASIDPIGAAEFTVAEFIEAIQVGSFSGWSFAFNDSIEAEEELATIGSGLGEYSIAVVAGAVEIVDPAKATTPLDITWTLADGVTFTTEGELDLVLVGTEWLVDWEPSALETSLDPGDTLVRERVVPLRAPILGRDGIPLVDNRPIVNIGVIPRQVDDVVALTAILAPLLDSDPAELQSRIAPAPSDSFVSLAVRQADEIEAVRGQLTSLPGVELQPGTFPATPNERFGRALFGRSAEVTAEIIDASPEIYQAGDIAGRSGLQRQYNERLTGVPGFQIRVDRQFPGTASVPSTTAPPAGADPSTTTNPADGVATTAVSAADAATDPDVIFLSEPQEGDPLPTTIDIEVQTAAEDALTETNLPSALVAIEVSTGQVLAVANGPEAAVDNLAMTGQFAPGSIFKIVTAYAALEQGLEPDTRVDCPEVLEVNGREFRNAEDEKLGSVPFWRAFALSCNTAFINVADQLDNGDFATTAQRLGVGAGYELGTDAFSGSVPNPGGPVEKAATSFGQSQVLVSPLSAAVMAASVAGGTFRQPTLIDPPTTPVADEPLDPATAEVLREMMRAVVTSGTGRAVDRVRGEPVAGKTGTAEFGNQDPPQAHAWFVGFQGDIAFAVFVEGGEFGGATAAPIAADFLGGLNG